MNNICLGTQINPEIEKMNSEEFTDDLISELPDAILVHILSFLDETTVVQSSVLSRRWRYLWTSVPFRHHSKHMRSLFMEEKIAIGKEKHCLEKMAANAISSISTSVAKHIGVFCLVSLWIITATQRNKKQFDIFMGCLLFMGSLSFSLRGFYKKLKRVDVRMKRLQERDYKLTSMEIYDSTMPKKMDLLFPENFQPRNANSAWIYGLFGFIIITSILFIMILPGCTVWR